METNDQSKPVLGLIGLGVMGSTVAEKFLAQGYPVFGYNRTKSKAEYLINKGLRWCDNPSEVIESCAYIFISVSDSASCLEVYHKEEVGILAGLKRSLMAVDDENVSEGVNTKIICDMSTISPAVSRDLAEEVRFISPLYDMLDVPISGNHINLLKGEGATMVGGRKESFEKVKSLLQIIGPKKTTYVGENGQALSLKVAHNLNLAVQMMAFSEAILLAESAGIDKNIAVDVLTHSAIASPNITSRGPLVLGLPEKAYFNMKMMNKDMELALEMGKHANIALPSTSLANQHIIAGCGMNLDKEDFAALYHVLGNLSGRPKTLR